MATWLECFKCREKFFQSTNHSPSSDMLSMFMNISWLTLVLSLFFQSQFEVRNQRDLAKLTLKSIKMCSLLLLKL